MTHDRETGLVYNNVYPDVNRISGLIIPKTLVKTEKRPKKQLKTSRHKRKRVQKLDDVEKQFERPNRVREHPQEGFDKNLKRLRRRHQVNHCQPDGEDARSLHEGLRVHQK